MNDDLVISKSARTVSELRRLLADLPDDTPVMLDGGGLLESVQIGEASAEETDSRTGFVDDRARVPVAVAWLLGEARD